ncbi:PTS-dependent dihydroxyacetone kinase phosphotransferase subunit DhaM [Heyndrickxia sporothermodurans]|uniref:phosphoenolpyruvate--glycerone phosphotransferase n=1 Tax=Heyndrickxia sporothermodurans TaxID=46224 RepID=A0A150LH60_9BACI|nr:dihydroxyacetone kinase phosphoryl donor subunit DhaM [Heyndrickxia sporothermodurans]KYD11082.1 Phosphoenolpyruvate-dihydroxyacetone phosphotransferase, subunit DhaM [Heyndrickxia sporothermodurans]MBL5767752.1 PTS-dependent dihydroxyacetone kinase phosphotransferase subunit DhaM [Heyndrickxia sporothermodurans]MBL5771258.1 PTS-dependent dihydroxyacetone kinase phosphotransferase subunit DhaM [Heyndrickxia sporothermodurans]MBL5776479.1 PTS-dependent dihydroxyacetone kinase phosphotransfera
MNNVGIVLISHSPKIVEGIQDILTQVVKNVPIGVAGGTDENEIGTSIEKIVAAINQVHNENGVILLYDLGSAMMNAELAFELTGYKNIKIAENIPLVEGAYIAAVESSMGNDIEKIIRSLRESF